MNLDRSEYSEIYRRTFGKTADREACHDGWRRWQKVWSSGHEVSALELHGAPMPEPHPNDYWAFAVNGPLRFLARINEAFLPQLPEGWLEFTRTEGGAKLLALCGQNPHSRAYARNRIESASSHTTSTVAKNRLARPYTTSK